MQVRLGNIPNIVINKDDMTPTAWKDLLDSVNVRSEDQQFIESMSINFDSFRFNTKI